MSFIDYGVIIILLCSIIIGYKNGVVKTTISLLAVVLSAFLAYQFKGVVANFLISVLPFVSFRGMFEGLTSMTILFYHGAAFLVIFIVIYNLLSILIILAGFIDKLLKMTVILYLPDKILGGVVGFIKGTMISFVLIFVMVQLPYTQEYIINSTYGYQILNRTPIIRNLLAETTVVSTEISNLVLDADTEDSNYIYRTETAIMQVFIKYGLITLDTAQSLVDNGKLELEGVSFN